MSFEDPNVGWEFWAAFLVIGLGFAVAWHAASTLPGRGKVGLLALWARAVVHELQGGLRAPRPVPREHLLRLAAGRSGRVRVGAAPAPDRLAGRRDLRARRCSPRCARTRPTYQPARAREQAGRPGAAALRRRRTRKGDPGGSSRAGRQGTARREPADGASATARSTSSRSTRACRGRRGCAGSRCRCSRPTRPTPPTSTSATPSRCARATGPTSCCARTARRSMTATRAFDAPKAMREIALPLPRGAAARPLGPARAHRTALRPARLFKTVEAQARRTRAGPRRARRRQRGLRADRAASASRASSGCARRSTARCRARSRSTAAAPTRSSPAPRGTGIVLRVPQRADYSRPFGLDQATNTLTITKSARSGSVRLRFFAMPIR